MLNFLRKNVEITDYSNFKTKAYSSYFYEINFEIDLDNLPEILTFSKQNNLKLLFIWAWTNMFFAFEKYTWIIIKNNLKWWNYNESSKILEAYSWNKIRDIAESLEKDFNQNIWHRFIWLPWSVGWAVFGNAWCFWLETENNLSEIKVFDLENFKIKVIKKEDAEFAYRDSIFKKTEKYFIISAKFDLSEKKEKYSSDVDNIDFRENKQPKWNTCWSFFANPKVNLKEFFEKFKELYNENLKVISAGFLIEKVGLKWFHLGWAYFSEKHANFLMSDWTATYKELLDLINLAKTKIKEEFSIEIENEVRIIKN